MKSRRTKDFRELLRALPKDVRRQAYEAYEQFKNDPFHPSLQFKRVSRAEPIYSARIGIKYRALGLRDPDDLITWFWIGSHAEYDQWLKS